MVMVVVLHTSIYTVQGERDWKHFEVLLNCLVLCNILHGVNRLLLYNGQGCTVLYILSPRLGIQLVASLGRHL